MKALKKILTWFILPLCIAGLAYLCVRSVMQPVQFNKQVAAREAVAIQRLKDIRTLQNSFKSEFGRYAPSFDSLKWYYNEGKIDVVLQFGSQDDSLADINRNKYAQRLHLKGPKLEQKLYELYQDGERVWGKVSHPIAVKDTLCRRDDFCIDSIAFIPACGDTVLMESTIKTVSGVKVPLFEAKMPYGEKVIVAPKTKSVDKNGTPIEIAEKYVIKEYLLRGLDHQLVVNLCTELIDTDRYPGLMVGSVSAPNNNAGNWE